MVLSLAIAIYKGNCYLLNWDVKSVGIIGMLGIKTLSPLAMPVITVARTTFGPKCDGGTEAETQSNSSQVLSLPQLLEEANPHQAVDKPDQIQLAATRSQMKLSYAEAAKLNNKRKKPTLLLYPSEENDKEIEEIVTEKN
ncbi:hypothetical protein AVEN_44623-1 [Araneus ventricosus]|uniref:Uncharacterized protein n=1 Tax=Araneus ventricosus TaxID=182803 RepID=A0A4Y2WX26_ARAVE|nr:hypothetical protein AVEN_44623-1 [Araneus ventricosus]